MDRERYRILPKSKNLSRLVIALPAGIFLSEVLAMVLILFYRGPYAITVLLDAIITTTLMLPIIYLISYRPLLKHVSEQDRADNIMQVRLQLVDFALEHTVDDLLQKTLDELEDLTDSEVSFFHFLDADQNTLWLQSWSTNTLQYMCKADGKGSHYSVDEAGVWAGRRRAARSRAKRAPPRSRARSRSAD